MGVWVYGCRNRLSHTHTPTHPHTHTPTHPHTHTPTHPHTHTPQHPHRRISGSCRRGSSPSRLRSSTKMAICSPVFVLTSLWTLVTLQPVCDSMTCSSSER